MSKPIRILIVDNQLRARQSLKALLSTKFTQAEISEATNGAEALQRAEELNPDIILMDVVMPHMDGLESTRLIKAISPRIKIILLSIYGDYRGPALAAGADVFISKGKPPEELLDTLDQLMSESSQR